MLVKTVAQKGLLNGRENGLTFFHITKKLRDGGGLRVHIFGEGGGGCHMQIQNGNESRKTITIVRFHFKCK